MEKSVYQSSSSGIVKEGSVGHSWVHPRHNLHVGSHDHCHATLGVSSFSFSAYKMSGMAVVSQGRMQLSLIEDHMQEGLGACSSKANFEIRCSEIASEAMFAGPKISIF